MIHIWRLWKLSSFQDPHSLVHLRQKISPPPWSSFKQTLPAFSIINQLKENIIQGWLLYVIRSFLYVSFRFQYQLINLIWIFFYFFSSSWSLIMWLYTLKCAVVQKNHGFYLYNYLHFQYSFCNQPVLFAQFENVNKLWNNNRTVHVNKQNKNKIKTNSRHIQVDHAFYCSI